MLSSLNLQQTYLIHDKQFMKYYEISEDICIPAGKIIKTYGKNRQVIIRFDVLDYEPFAGLKIIYLKIHGLLVPFFVDNIRLKNNGTATLLLRHLDSDAKAKEISGCIVFVDKEYVKIKKSERPASQKLIGYNVNDIKYGDLGLINEIIELPGNPLFKIIYNEKELLIQVTEAYMKKIDKKNKILVMELPEGLIEL